jgi:hypothetical protein
MNFLLQGLKQMQPYYSVSPLFLSVSSSLHTSHAVFLPPSGSKTDRLFVKLRNVGEVQSKRKITHFNCYPVTRGVFCCVDRWKGKGKVLAIIRCRTFCLPGCYPKI